jgi:hypothetical protein
MSGVQKGEPMAFISEINFSGSDFYNEWAEVALGPDDDPSDFVLSVYRDIGTLHTGAGISNGEVNLGTLTGVSDPDDPGWTIYQIHVGIKTHWSDSDEGNGLALTDISTGGGVIDFYSGSRVPPLTPTTGAAAGATTDNSLDYTILEAGHQSVQWDYEGNRYNGDLTPGDARLICFTRGTLIKTDQGERPIEDLAAGDMVLTMDHEYQPIRWIGSSKRAATGDLAPILIRKSALGNDRDLRVSPQHRMLLQGWQAEMLFGEVEVLATAKSLLNDHSIIRDEGGEVEYFHMLFDTHEIIYAEGCLSESFHPGKKGWKALDQATRDEILTLFPQLADGNLNDYGPAARMSLKHKEGKLLGSYMAGSSPSTKKASSSNPTWLAALSLKLVNRLRPSGWF